MAFAGLRGTGDWAADERPKNFRAGILWSQPNGTAPLTALMSKMKKQETDDPEFSWWEEENGVVRVQASAAILGTTDTTATFTSGGLALVAGDMLLIEKTETASYDNEIVLVSSVTDDTTVVIKRGQFGTTPTAVPISSFYTHIGNAFAEGTNSPNVQSRNPEKRYNYTQIFKTAYELTGTAESTNTRTGDPIQNDKKRKMFDHSKALENTWMWGVRSEGTGPNGKPLRTSAGMRTYISTNRTIFTTTPTESAFFDAIYPVFNYDADGVSGNERLVLAGNGFLNSLNKLAAGGLSSTNRMRHTDTVKYYGMELMRWTLPQGTLYVKTHPLMNLHPRFNNSAFVINPSSIIYRYMKGRDTKFKDNVQANDADTRKGMWITEAGIEFQHEKSAAYIGNFVV